MVYNLTKYNGSPLATVQDSSIDTTSTSIALIGRNTVNFGLPLNENFIALMQHFANTTPPPSPVQGQIWFDTVASSLKVWDGYRWLLITPPFDGNAGTATVSISPSAEVMLVLSAGQIVSAFSHQQVNPSQLSDEVMIAGVTYPFKPRFPNGMAPGITLAVDPNGYRFFGTATSSNVLATARNISINGSMTGNVMFDGSNDVVITSNLINVLNANLSTSSYWSKVLVGSNGLVTDANVIVDQDIFTALGYTPPSNVIIRGDAFGNTNATGTVFNVTITLSNTTVTPGTYNNVTVDAAGRVISANNDSIVPIQGIILSSDPLVPTGWALCDGSVVATPAGSIQTPALTAPVSTTGPATHYIMRVS